MVTGGVYVDEEAAVTRVGEVVHPGRALFDASPLRAREGRLAGLGRKAVCELDGEPMTDVRRLHKRELSGLFVFLRQEQCEIIQACV